MLAGSRGTAGVKTSGDTPVNGTVHCFVEPVTLLSMPSAWSEGRGVWSDGTDVYTVGSTYSLYSGSASLLLVKWDVNGNQVWHRTWTNNGNVHGQGAWGHDGNIYTVATVVDPASNVQDIALLKWDAGGTLAWVRSWGGTGQEEGRGVWCNGDAIFTTGSTTSHGDTRGDVAVVRWGPGGMLEWNATWGDADTDAGLSIKGRDDVIYVTGYTRHPGTGTTSLLLVNLDAISGNVSWARMWSHVGDAQGRDAWIDDTGVTVVGFVASVDGSKASMVVVKWNHDGELLWDHVAGSTASERAYGAWSDGQRVFIAGSVEPAGTRDLNAWLAALTLPGGTRAWEGSWGSGGIDEVRGIWSDGLAFYMAGSMEDVNSGTTRMVLVKHVPLVAPGIPVDLVASTHPEGLLVSWLPPPGGWPPVSSYSVYRATINAPSLVKVASTTGTSFLDTSVRPGVLYRYAVRAVNDAGDGDFSAEILASTDTGTLHGLEVPGAVLVGAIACSGALIGVAIARHGTRVHARRS